MTEKSENHLEDATQPHLNRRPPMITVDTTEAVSYPVAAISPAHSAQASTSSVSPLSTGHTPSNSAFAISDDQLLSLPDQGHSALLSPSSTAYSPSTPSPVDTSTFAQVDYDRLLNTGTESQGDNPFAFAPSQLAKLHDPKDLDVLRAMGGILGLAFGLRADIEKGLSPDEVKFMANVTLRDVRHALEMRKRILAKGKGDREELTDPNRVFRELERQGTRPQENTTFSLVAKTFSIITQHSEFQFEDRRRIFSTNRIPLKKPKNIFELMWEALHDRILILLSIAAVVSLGLGFYQSFRPGAIDKVEWVQGVAILVAIAVITVVQALNDYQQELKFMKLNAKKEDRYIKLVRNGRTTLISVYDVVVGDLMLIEAGDVIPVDAILVDGYDVMCDESTSTGEGDALKKVAADVALQSTQPGVKFEKKFDPFILSGARVLGGVGKCIVTAVGVNSYHGRTLMSAREKPEDTPLQVKLNGVVNVIVKIGGITALLLFAILFIKFLTQLPGSKLDAAEKGQQFIEVLIVSIIILVIAVPEGLPLAVTLALAFATIRMLKDQNLVRVLKACETMGNVTAVCSDKTGTLTQNRMTVVAGTLGVSDRFGTERQRSPENIGTKEFSNSDVRQVDDGQGEMASIQSFLSELPPKMNSMLRQSITANSTAFESTDGHDGKEFVGSKTETALLELAQTYLGMDDLSTERNNNDVVQIFPFSSEYKCMGVVVKHQLDGETNYRLFVKGASEMLLMRCDRVVKLVPNDVSILPLSEQDRTLIKYTIDEYASRSLRTIGMVYRDFHHWPPKSFPTSDNRPSRVDVAEIFAPMTWIGVMGIKDPLRPGVIRAVQDCQNAGVCVRMVTGDNVMTAKVIATECGIFKEGGIIMEGPLFRALDSAEMDRVIPSLQVLARSSPEDKRILVSRLKALGEIVAVTGDGTNDGPALRTANVGFSMGIAGTEVAKEASSIILMDDDFASIVKAIMWGRCVNDAVKKFLQFQLTVTVSAVVLAFVSSIASGDEQSVLTVVQLLWINLIQDTFAALALATDPPTLSLLKRKPEPKNASIITFNMWKTIIGQSMLQLTITFILVFAGPRIFTTWNEHDLKTTVFNTFSWLQMSNLINCRRIDNRLNVFSGVFRNYFFITIILITVGGQILIIYVGGSAFSVTRLNGAQWATSIILGLLSLPFGALLRLIPNRFIKWCIPRGFLRWISRAPIVDEEMVVLERNPAVDEARAPVKEVHDEGLNENVSIPEISDISVSRSPDFSSSKVRDPADS